MLEDNKTQTDDQGADDIVVQTADGGEEESDNASDPTAEMLKDAPSHVQRAFSMAISRQVGNPLLEKFNAEHIHKVLDYRDAGNQRNHKFALAFFLAALVAVVGVLVFLVWQDERELAGQVLAGLAIFGGGFGGGYGLGRRR